MCRALLSSIQFAHVEPILIFQVSRISVNTLTTHINNVEIRATKIVPCTYQWIPRGFFRALLPVLSFRMRLD
jgi:hypothetical protein